MNTYKNYLKGKNSYFHNTEKKILNLLKPNDLKNKDKFLSSKVKNRLINSLIYLHQYKPKCEIRKNFRNKYNLEMHGGKKEMITLKDIIAPVKPSYTHSDLEKQFQEVTTKIFNDQKQHVYPDGDSKLFLSIPQYDFNYKINKQEQQKKEVELKNNTILNLLRQSGKNSLESRNILNEINKNKRNKLELINYLNNQTLNQDLINQIIELNKNNLEKIELKQDLNQINQLTDIITESKSRTTKNFIQTSREDINNNLSRTEMYKPNNLIFNSMSEYNLEFVNLRTETQQKCKYQIKDDNSKKNNEIRKKYKEYQNYDDIIDKIKSTKIRDPNHSYEYIYDIEQILNLMPTVIKKNKHTKLYNKIDEYRNFELDNNNIISEDKIKELNNALLGFQLLYEINNLNTGSNVKEIDFLKKKLYSPGIKYSKIKNLVDYLNNIGRNTNIDGTTTNVLLRNTEFKNNLFVDLDTNINLIYNTLLSYSIPVPLRNNNLKDYFNINSPTDILKTIQDIINIYLTLIKNNNSIVNLDVIKKSINSLIKEIINKEDLLKEIKNFDNSCKLNTECKEDNLCHLKKCIYEVLASSGSLKGRNLTGLEIRNNVEQKFKKLYPEFENQNFINECNWLDGKVVSFLEDEYNIRIILINKFDYNFNEELVEYNEFQNVNKINKDETKKGTLEDLKEITSISQNIKNVGINYINKNSISSATQSKYSVKNTQGSVLCQNLVGEQSKNFNKAVFIIYNTDDNYQLLKINNKTQLNISDIPFELKKFVNNSCETSNPILKFNEKELIENRMDYKLLEKKILDFLNKNKLTKNSDKQNYFKNLINLYLEQDEFNKINYKLNNLKFKIENNNFVTNLQDHIDFSNCKILKLRLKRNNKTVAIPNYDKNVKMLFNLGNRNEDYILFLKIKNLKNENKKLIIEVEDYETKLISEYFKYDSNMDFIFEVVNHNKRTEFLLKLFDFICYLNNEPDNYHLNDLDEIILNNQYLRIIVDNLNSKDEFLKAFKFYKYTELEKLYNSNIYSDNYSPSLIFMVKPQELFNNLVKLILELDKDNQIKKDNINFIESTKLYQIYNNNNEKLKLINMLDNLSLEYQYLFSIFIRDFFAG